MFIIPYLYLWIYPLRPFYSACSCCIYIFNKSSPRVDSLGIYKALINQSVQYRLLIVDGTRSITAPRKGSENMTVIFERKEYIHFDDKLEFTEKVEKYVREYSNNPRHNFLPLIYDEITFDKFLDITGESSNDHVKRTNSLGKSRIIPIKIKTRPIMYASHIDNYIYKYYGLELNQLYNDYLLQNTFDDSSIAYRTNKTGKSNIDFAAEVIDFIKKTEDCYIYIGDFTGFFDNLNHKYLKKMILTLYANKSVPKHQYEIFKSITKFSYVHRKDIDYYTRDNNKKYKRGFQRYFKKMSDFRKFKREVSIIDNSYKVLRKNLNDYGIPQGTAISAIYSNIYMLDSDERINNIISKKNGIYRRYSDDYIIVLPNMTENEFLSIKMDIEKILRTEANLTIHPEKTQVMEYNNGNLLDFKTKNSSTLDYLGFVFDGDAVKMREKSVYNFYRTAYQLINKGIVISNQKRHTRLTYKRKLYQRYHRFGERTDQIYHYKPRPYGTFITYAYKCQKIFDKVSPNTTNLMTTQISNHEKKIRKKIIEAKNKLKNF